MRGIRVRRVTQADSSTHRFSFSSCSVRPSARMRPRVESRCEREHYRTVRPTGPQLVCPVYIKYNKKRACQRTHTQFEAIGPLRREEDDQARERAQPLDVNETGWVIPNNNKQSNDKIYVLRVRMQWMDTAAYTLLLCSIFYLRDCIFSFSRPLCVRRSARSSPRCPSLLHSLSVARSPSAVRARSTTVAAVLMPSLSAEQSAFRLLRATIGSSIVRVDGLRDRHFAFAAYNCRS